MLDTFDIRTDDMPEETRILLQEYPRDLWEAHPGFREKTRHWLGAHHMFRRLGQLVRTETEQYLDKARAPEDYASRLSYFGDALVRNLHGHHSWEDHSYFPELSAADPRFDAGLKILEMDHDALDGVLDAFTSSVNRTIKLIHLAQEQAREEAGSLHRLTVGIEAFLTRHLNDEEELAVPIILRHRLRG
jgi:hemerythrin-like domain-containing protein